MPDKFENVSYDIVLSFSGYASRVIVRSRKTGFVKYNEIDISQTHTDWLGAAIFQAIDEITKEEGEHPGEIFKRENGITIGWVKLDE